MSQHPDNANLPVVNRPETITGVVVTFITLALVAMSLRIYVRLRAGRFGWDDFFIALAAAGTTAGSTMSCLMPSHGLGLHFWTLSRAQTMNYFKYVWATNVCYSAATAFIKIAILLQYLRLFDITQSRVARTAIWALTVLIALWGAMFLLLALFACWPIAKNWNIYLPGKCVAWGSKEPNVFFATWAAQAATNMFFDILVFVLPLPFLRGLRLQGKTRLGLLGLFTVGGVVVSLSIVRMVSLSIRRVGTVPVFDPTFATPLVYISSALEVNVAIICASIPIWWPLVTSFAAHKIYVINEIEVRTHRVDSQSQLALAEQGAVVGTVGVPGLEMGKEADGGRASRMNVVAYGLKPTNGGKMGRSGSKLTKSAEARTHRSKPSTEEAADKEASVLQHGRSISGESQRRLTLLHEPSDGALSLSFSSTSSKRESSPLRRGLPRFQQDRYVLIPLDRGRRDA